MITIPISGIIANYEMDSESNVTPVTLRKSLDDANGQDVLITINSPGGLISAGMEMFSMIQNYPGKTETRAVSFAASMGSVLTLAGDKKTAESTAMYYIHNAQGGSYGDYLELRKDAQYLEDYSELLAEIYAENLNFTIQEARDAMDKDSQYFRESLQNIGIDIVSVTGSFNPATARIKNSESIKAIAQKITKEDREADYEKVAALVGTKKKPQITAQKTAAVTTGKNNKEKNEMDEIKNLSDLENKFPDLFAQAVQKGIDQEIDRTEAHLTLGQEAGCIDLAIENIRSKAEFSSSVSAKYMAEGMKNKDIKNSTDDNADDTGDGEATDEEETKAFTAKFMKRMGGAK